ncbi:MAG: leucine-rich repeat domain-containing protein [Bacteroidales bacterium]|nr:leucine-rich repeat domain-containing protein [Bacteroidales bacterium]
MKRFFFLFAILCCTMAANAQTQPDNEIWYTSTDGQVVYPNNTHAFGATILSNTYQNGKGVIKFNGTATSIGDEAFWNCLTLNGITIPNSVINFGSYAFTNCPNLTDIAIPNAVESIGNYAFAYTGLTNITIPSSVTSIVMTAFQSCPNLTTMIVEHGNTVYDSRNNCNAIIETGTNTLISGCKNSVIPSGVTSIGNYAFRSCTLASITIPNSVTTIGMRAFYGCTALEYIIFMPDTPPSFLPDCFEDCSKLSIIYVPEEAVNTYKDKLSSYADIIKAINIEEIIAAAIAEIQNAFDGETGSAYLNGLIADEMAAINNATTIEIITENKVAALAKLSAAVPVYKEGKAEAFGNLPTEGTSGSYVKVILGEKTIKLYNPEKVEFGKE